MIQEDKELLFKDLFARYPYGVICDMWDNRPYLRSMSSMTEKEKRAFDKFMCIDEDAWHGKENGCVNQAKIMSGGIDWLNEHHFDFRGLIERGLALEAPEGLYKTE